MSEAKHSPEPWRVVEPDKGKGDRWEPGVDSGLGEAVLWDGCQTDAKDLRRIVACVNACEGLTTEGLEAGELGGLIQAAAWFARRPATGTKADDEEARGDLVTALRSLGRLP